MINEMVIVMTITAIVPIIRAITVKLLDFSADLSDELLITLKSTKINPKTKHRKPAAVKYIEIEFNTLKTSGFGVSPSKCAIIAQTIRTMKFEMDPPSKQIPTSNSGLFR